MFKHFSYWALDNYTFEIFFAKSAKEEGQRVQKIAEKIRYFRRDAFADDPLEAWYRSSQPTCYV